MTHRCGFVAIVGRPNVGKSTLLNRILGQKLSITSRKPQTTRHRILGVKTTADYQAIYVDTPGLHRGSSRALNRYMNRTALSAMEEVDVVVFVVEVPVWTDADEVVHDALSKRATPVIVALNKIDRIDDKSALLPIMAELAERTGYQRIVPISGTRGTNVSRLETEVGSLLPTASRLYPEDQVTDRPQQFFVAELIREKFLARLGQELPYRLSVQVEYFEASAERIDIGAIVWIERRSQKGIVIGKQGHLMRTVGIEARAELERTLEKKVNLKLWAKVKEEWSDDELALPRLGYE